MRGTVAEVLGKMGDHEKDTVDGIAYIIVQDVKYEEFCTNLIKLLPNAQIETVQNRILRMLHGVS